MSMKITCEKPYSSERKARSREGGTPITRLKDRIHPDINSESSFNTSFGDDEYDPEIQPMFGSNEELKEMKKSESKDYNKEYGKSPKRQPVEGLLKVREGFDIYEFGRFSDIIEELPDEELSDDIYNSDMENHNSTNYQEELKYKVPIKLLIAAKHIAETVKNLPKDEYGDIFYDGNNPDDEHSQRLKKTGEQLLFWINKMFQFGNEKDIERLAKHLKKPHITYDKCTQISDAIETTPNTLSVDKRKNYISSKKMTNNNVTIMPSGVKVKRKPVKANFVNKLRKSMFFSNTTGGPSTIPVTPTTPQYTEAVPFNFNDYIKKHGKIQISILPKYIIVFQKSYEYDKKKILSQFRAIPMKLFIKSLNSIYVEKSVNAKNSKACRSQNMAEFLYDNTYNKYGIAKLTEKKISTICLTTIVNYKKYPEIELFAYFIGLGGKFYTNDDLTFYYRIDRILSNFNMEESQDMFSVLEIYFKGLVSVSQMAQIRKMFDEH